MRDQAKVIIGIIVLIIVVIFAIQNTNMVELDLFFISFSTPLVLVILFSLLIGVIIGLASTSTVANSNRKQNRELTKQIDRSKEEYAQELNNKDQTISELRAQLQEVQRRNTNTSTVDSSPTVDYNSTSTTTNDTIIEEDNI